MGCGGEQKVTDMVLKVDLKCDQCYRKVKKLLCKFPQIRNQVYDEKQNTVKIKVVCCSPERIRDKLCSKGGKSINGIDIIQPKKADPGKPPSAPVPITPPVEAPPKKPKDPTPAPAPKPQPEAPAPPPADQKPPEKIQKNGSKNGSKSEPPQEQKPSEKPPKAAEPEADPKPKPVQVAAPGPEPPKASEAKAQWMPGYPAGGPPPQAYPVPICCAPCYEGVAAGPCYQPGNAHGNYGYGYGYGYGRPLYQPGYYPPTNRCDDYFSDENPSTCSTM